MANKVQHDYEDAIEAGTLRRVAAVLARLVRDGVLPWSAHAGTPVTGRPDELTDDIEEWLRHG